MEYITVKNICRKQQIIKHVKYDRQEMENTVRKK